MRQALITLLLALTLVLGLSGCTDNKDTKTNSKTRNYTDYNYGTNDNNGTNYNNGTSKNYNYDTNNNSVGSELKRETEDLLRGRSYDEMLRNGRINDTDGILTDGENPISR